MGTIDPYYAIDLKEVTIVRLRKGKHWMPHARFKDYVESATGRQRQLEDHNVFRSERDAAIALSQYLVAMARKRVNEAQSLQAAVKALIDKHDLGDCPYIVPVQVA